MSFIGGMKKHGRGIRTKFSDDLLWLAYVTIEYIRFTGDKEILDIDSVCFHPNVNTASIKFSPLDIKKVLDNFNANYVFMEV